MARVAPRATLAVLLLAGGLSACAPQETGSTYSPYAVGRSAGVTYGTVVGARPVTVRGGRTGVGTTTGAIAGGFAGSFIGGDWRSSLLAGLGGAIIGGIAGTAIEAGATTGTAVEFIVREDGGGDIATVQTNEDGIAVGERVAIIRGDRTRLARAASSVPAGGAARPGLSASPAATIVAGTPEGVPRSTPLAGYGVK